MIKYKVISLSFYRPLVNHCTLCFQTLVFGKKFNLENLEKLSRREGKQNYCPVQELKRTIQEGGEADIVNFKNSEKLSRRDEKQKFANHLTTDNPTLVSCRGGRVDS